MGESVPLWDLGTLQDLFRKFSHHDLSTWLQIKTFYTNLGAFKEFMIDLAIGGALMSKTLEMTYKILDELISNNYQWSDKRSSSKPIVGVM